MAKLKYIDLRIERLIASAASNDPDFEIEIIKDKDGKTTDAIVDPEKIKESKNK